MNLLNRNKWPVFLGSFILLFSLLSYQPAQGQSLTSIDVTPANPTINVGQTLPFTATGTFSDASTQVLGSPATSVEVGEYHSCAVLSDGTVQCWGLNNTGQLGNGTNTGPELCNVDPCSTTPVAVSGITTATAVAAGGYHSCALLLDSTIKCWGNNNYGQLGNGTIISSFTPVAVSGITTATAIAAGDQHTCAVLSNGTVRCWGQNITGQLGNGTTTNSSTPVAVSGITTATGVTTVFDHTCVLLLDGTVKCWGYNSDGQLGNGNNTGPQICPYYNQPCSTAPVFVSGINTATAIAAGYLHTCVVLSDGTVRCWGNNQEGELGDGTTTGSFTPVTVGGVATATAITAGFDHTCVLLLDSTLQCWGRGYNGELGDGTTAESDTPVLVSGITTATAVAASSYNTCAVLSDGTVKCWGQNDIGQLGNGTIGNSSTPVLVSGITTATAIAAGFQHTCAGLSDGTVKCWGYNGNGQLGDGTTTDSFIPIAVSGISTSTAIAAGTVHTCAVLSDGTVHCWGSNYFGQLGDGTTTNSSTPVAVSGISTATAIAAGGDHTCAVLSDGTVQCWGYNGNGELGNGTNTGPEGCTPFGQPQPCSTIPVVVSGITTAIVVAPGNHHTCAVLSDGTVQCWGNNYQGQLGNGTTINSTTPVAVSGIATATAVAAGDHTCALLSDGTVRCWGLNDMGQLGNGTPMLCNGYPCSTTPMTVSGITTATSIAARSDHNCVRLSGGTVQCWGANGMGQLGNGTTTLFSSTPVSVSGITTAIDVTAGGYHSCASLSDGTVRCWGYNGNGQLGDGTAGYSPIPVAVSGIFPGVAWSSSNTGVATIDANGLATGLSPGTTTITATSGSIGGNTTLTVNPTYTLILTAAGSGSGTVSGAGTYNSGQTATVSATANPGSTFTGWTGPNAAECATGSVLMNANKSCTANFTLNTYTLTLTTAGTGSGTVSGAGTYNYGQTATVSASANPGSTFTGWTGPNAAECTTGSVLMNANKSCTANFTLNTSLPDLIISALSTTATAVAPGKTFVLSNTVKNQGTATAGSSIVAFHLSTNAVYGDGDDIAFTATRSVASLVAGASSSGNTTLTVPPAAALGTYYICAMADSGGAVNEGTNESNNSSCTGGTIQVTRADLIMTAVTPTVTTVNQGGTLPVFNTVKNQGLISSTSFRIAFHLSVDDTYGGANDVALTTIRSVTSLGPGISSSATTNLAIPLSTPPNTYYVCAYADSLNAVIETDDGNNTLCSQVQVTVPQPDLIVSALSTTATTVKAGAIFYVSNSIKNQGGSKAGSSVVAFHLSLDTTYGGGDDIASTTTRTITSLAINATSAASTVVRIPATTPPGTYYVCVQADTNNSVAELNETNNERCTTNTITVTP